MPTPQESTRCAFVALIGAPNVGKSTLVNALVGAKVTIVSPKVQTTRTLVRGIAMEGRAQLVFIDTPGIFAPRRRLDRAMVTSAWSGAHDADIVGLLIDARTPKVSRPTTQKNRRKPASPRIEVRACSWAIRERKRVAAMNATLTGSTRIPQNTGSSGASACAVEPEDVTCRSQNVCVFSYTLITCVSRKIKSTAATAKARPVNARPV